MKTIEMFLKEVEQEAITTRKMLARVPNDSFDWQPHPKSMTIRQLATHIADLPGWIAMALTTDELDFAANPYKPEEVNNTADLLAVFEKNLATGIEHLKATNEDILKQNWTLRNGDDIFMTDTKAGIVRVSISQTIHHRAQLGVFLRLLNVPIPGSYGPSADEQEFALLEQE
jgi:uncharacterized damage-inducible protein DinB